VLVLAGCEERRATAVRFVELTTPPLRGALVVDGSSRSIARVALLEALDARSGAPTLVGAGPWRTVAVVRGAEVPADAARSGRTYVRWGRGAVRVEVKLAAATRGAFTGGVVETSATRALVQIRVEDPERPTDRFRLEIVGDDGRRRRPPGDVTPRYLAHAVPRGTYRAFVDVPDAGGRYLVHVVSTTERGDRTSDAWTSPIAVERPWLARD